MDWARFFLTRNYTYTHHYIPFTISVGGIYTVIRSKAPAAVDELGNKYCLIGIYNDVQCKTEVEMMEPEDPSMKGAIQALRDSGVEVQCYSETKKSVNSINISGMFVLLGKRTNHIQIIIMIKMQAVTYIN